MASRKSIIEKAVGKDLADEQTQAEILSPPGTEITIGGKPMRVYPLSGRAVRELTGLANQVFASALGDGPMSLRVGGVLVQPRYLATFIGLLAAATFASPQDLQPEQHEKIAVEIDEATANARGVIELADAFGTLVEMNDVTAGFRTDTGKK